MICVALLCLVSFKNISSADFEMVGNSVHLCCGHIFLSCTDCLKDVILQFSSFDKSCVRIVLCSSLLFLEDLIGFIKRFMSWAASHLAARGSFLCEIHVPTLIEGVVDISFLITQASFLCCFCVMLKKRCFFPESSCFFPTPTFSCPFFLSPHPTQFGFCSQDFFPPQDCAGNGASAGSPRTWRIPAIQTLWLRLLLCSRVPCLPASTCWLF